MDRWIVSQVVDLATGETTFAGGYEKHAVRGDNISIQWDVEVMSNGDAANISGSTVMAYGNRPGEQASCIAQGTVTNNHCSVKIPQQFLAINGKVKCLMTLTDATDRTTVTIAELDLDVEQGPYGAIIDPGEVMPDISQGLAAIEQLSDYILESAEVEGVVLVELTGTNTYEVVYADGTSYTLTADGGDITIV